MTTGLKYFDDVPQQENHIICEIRQNLHVNSRKWSVLVKNGKDPETPNRCSWNTKCLNWPNAAKNRLRNMPIIIYIPMLVVTGIICPLLDFIFDGITLYEDFKNNFFAIVDIQIKLVIAN